MSSTPQTSDSISGHSEGTPFVGTSTASSSVQEFFPSEPTTFAETGLTANDVEALALKVLMNQGAMTGRKIADQIRLPFPVIAEFLRALKNQMLVTYKSSGAMGDYEHELTDSGWDRARRWAQRTTFSGAAPVPLRDYVAGVKRQSFTSAKPKLGNILDAFKDLCLPPAILSQIGQALHAGRGMFLYGKPGNGKTSVAERVISALGQTIWIPRNITVTGEIIRVFDPSVHVEVPYEEKGAGLLKGTQIDKRWIRIKRPTLVVGGELTLSQLEMNLDRSTGVIESPIQLKSNGGGLVIDDFGRQRCSPEELLNRWIIPLEKQCDYLTLPSGRHIQAPFDQALIFATNLNPSSLVDEAFLRRIPYKIEMTDPSESDFRTLLKRMAQNLEVEQDEDTITYLIDHHFKKPNREMRYCHPRDLMLQIKHYCEFHEVPKRVSRQLCDLAVKSYFSGGN